MTMGIYREQQQVIELEAFAAGLRPESHPDPELYGSAWGDPKTDPRLQPVLRILQRTLWSEAVNPYHHVVEIGCGGGRWTKFLSQYYSREADHYRLIAIDGTAAAFDLTRRYLEKSQVAPVDQYILCPDGNFTLQGLADVVFSFDVFVHFNDELIFRYLNSIAGCLRRNGKFICSFAALFPPGEPGFERSDEWFNYQINQRQLFPSFREMIERDFTWYIAHSLPKGFGQQLMILTRK